LQHNSELLLLLTSLLFAGRALDHHWIVSKCFQLRVGFAADGPDLLSGFLLHMFSFFVKCTKFGKLILTKIMKIVATTDARFKDFTAKIYQI